MTELVNFITAGCSFSAGSSDIEVSKKRPQRWPQYLLDKLNPEFFYNLSVVGGGNTQIANNLIYMLETKPHVTPENTLIGINFTALDRIDTMCAVDHPSANKSFSWAQNFGFSWITQGSFICRDAPFKGILQKHMELKQIQTTSCLAVIQCLSYLDLKGFNYFFMLMDDTIIDDAPKWFRSSLTNKRKQNYITFGEHNSMNSFTRSKNLISWDGFHPSEEGHQAISNKVNEFLMEKNYDRMDGGALGH